MINQLKDELFSQFGSTIQMLENAINICPDTCWDTDELFWYRAYHTLFYLDYYLSEDPSSFLPPTPFTLSEFDPEGIMPDRTYTTDELIAYLNHCRQKAQTLIMNLNEETIQSKFVNEYKNMSRLEIIFYNMRHVQHHVGQLNMILSKHNVEVPRWVSQTKPDLS